MFRCIAPILAALLLSISSPNQAFAECGPICQKKCKDNPGRQSVQNCIKLWRCINAKYGSAAVTFENRRPPPECRHLYKPK